MEVYLYLGMEFSECKRKNGLDYSFINSCAETGIMYNELYKFCNSLEFLAGDLLTDILINKENNQCATAKKCTECPRISKGIFHKWVKNVWNWLRHLK